MPIGNSAWQRQLGQTPNYKWTITGVLFFIGALNYADRTVITAVFPLLRAELGMSDVALGGLGTMFLWSYALVSPLAGLVGDRLSRRSLILWSLAGWSLVTMLSGVVASGGQLLGMRVFLGISEALYLPSALALLAVYHGPETRAKAMALHVISLQFGQVVGGTAGGLLAELHGWRFCLYVMGGIGVVLAAICSFLLVEPEKPARDMRDSGRKSSSSAHGFGEILRAPSFLIILTQAMAVAFGVWIFVNWMPLYFHETFRMTLARAGFFGTAMNRIGSALGILLGGFLSDRIARKGAQLRALLQSISYGLCAPLLLAFVCSENLGLISGAIILYSFLLSVGQAGEMPLLTELVHPKRWSTAVGLYNASACLAGGAGILLAGYMKRELTLSQIFSSVAAIVLLASLLLGAGYLFFFQRDLERIAREKAALASPSRDAGCAH